MWQKYFIYIEGQRPIALKHNGRILRLGSYVRCQSVMETILKVYCNVDPFSRSVKTEYPQKNKMRYSFLVDREGFLEILKRMKDAGLSVVPTKSHERVMR